MTFGKRLAAYCFEGVMRSGFLVEQRRDGQPGESVAHWHSLILLISCYHRTLDKHIY